MQVQGYNLPVHLTANGLALSGPGALHSVTINTKGASASVTTVYDGIDTSGTVIAIIDSLNLSGPFVYDVSFHVGCYLTITGAADVTVAVARVN